MIHETELRVRFGDLDPYDHLNHARAFTFFESARVEALEALGYGLDRIKEDGVQSCLSSSRPDSTARPVCTTC